jgi:hypothetical protein
MRPVGVAAIASTFIACAYVAGIDQFHGKDDQFHGKDGGGPTLEAGVDIGDAADAPTIRRDADADAVDPNCVLCASGKCEPDGACVMATGLGDTRTIALVGNLVVFAEEEKGRLLACPRTGCPTGGPTVLQAGGHGMRLQRPEFGGGNTVLFRSDGPLSEVLANGTLNLVQNVVVTSAQVSNSWVLHVSDTVGVTLCDRSLANCNVIGGSTRPTCALVGSVVVWAGANSGIASLEASQPSAAAISNHTAAGDAPVSLLAADTSNVHGIANDIVFTWPLDGGQAKQLAQLSTPAKSLSVDSAYLYVAGIGIRVINKASGQMETRFQNRTTYDVVTDAAMLFWVENDSLVRAPK